MTDVTLGIDIGTGSTKAGLVDAEGRVMDVARAPHAIAEPRQGWSESDPDDWLTSTSAAVSDVLARQEDATVTAIAMSGQMHGVVVCDSSGRPLRPAVLWSDRRAQQELERLREQFDELRQLANPLVAGMAGPTVAALAQNEADLLARAGLLLQPKDWVRRELTGVVATDPSDASATLLWDTTADAWSLDACAVFDVDPGWLPEVRSSHEQAGRLTDAAASRLGLAEGIPVAVGAADTAAALLGAGVDTGETQVSTGTGGQIARLLGEPITDPHRRTHLYRAAQPDRWYAMAAIQNAGLAIDWALEVLDSDFDHAEHALAATDPGARGAVFLPYLTGERTPHMNAELTGQWAGLHRGVTRDDLVRAVFEGVAFALRDGLDALLDAGHSIDSALLAGGGSEASWWRQLLADVLDLPLVAHDATDASVRGAALLAWQGLDHRVDPAAVIRRSPAVEPARARDYAEARATFHDVAATATSAS